jgi:glutathione S-transferase
MLTVHHLNNSRSQRVLWLLEELGVPYEIKRYQRDPKTMLAPPELRAVHPLGKSPVITDDGQTIAESGAIIEYLIGKYGQGRFAPAPGTPEHLRYTYWLHYAEGSAMPPLLLKLVALRTAADVQMSFPLEAATARGGMEGQIPAITGFLKRIHARPAYQRALERGGKYEIVGAD